MSRAGRLALALLPAVCVLVLWEWASRAGQVSLDGFSRPSIVAATFAAALADGSMLQLTWQTLSAAAFGWVIAGAAAIAAGVVLGLAPGVERLMTITIEALRPIPSAALIPVALLLFGFGPGMDISVVVFACFWPVLIVTIAAVRGIEPRLIEVGRVLGFAFLRRIWLFALPAALPAIAVGLRVAAGIAIVVSVTVEIAANPRGLGFGMITAQQSLRGDLMWAYLIWLGLVGYAINCGLLAAERRWLGWFWAERGTA